jgi:hypothetical protein
MVCPSYEAYFMPENKSKYFQLDRILQLRKTGSIVKFSDNPTRRFSELVFRRLRSRVAGCGDKALVRRGVSPPDAGVR